MHRTKLSRPEESDKKIFWLVTLVALVLAAILPTLDDSDNPTVLATQFRSPASESKVASSKSNELEKLSPLITQPDLQTPVEQRIDLKKVLGVQIGPRNKHSLKR